RDVRLAGVDRDDLVRQRLRFLRVDGLLRHELLHSIFGSRIAEPVDVQHRLAHLGLLSAPPTGGTPIIPHVPGPKQGRTSRPGATDSIEPVTITAAADGSALGNPGPAGWGWYIDGDRWAAGGWSHGTNNQGELTAVLDLLTQTAHLPDDLVIYCDSQYAINSISKWMAGWKRRGWRKADGKPVMNVEILKALDACMTQFAAQGRKVEFRWVRGHAGHPLNEAADRLANGAAAAYSR